MRTSFTSAADVRALANQARAIRAAVAPFTDTYVSVRCEAGLPVITVYSPINLIPAIETTLAGIADDIQYRVQY